MFVVKVGGSIQISYLMVMIMFVLDSILDMDIVIPLWKCLIYFVVLTVF